MKPGSVKSYLPGWLILFVGSVLAFETSMLFWGMIGIGIGFIVLGIATIVDGGKSQARNLSSLVWTVLGYFLCLAGLSVLAGTIGGGGL